MKPVSTDLISICINITYYLFLYQITIVFDVSV